MLAEDFHQELDCLLQLFRERSSLGISKLGDGEMTIYKAKDVSFQLTRGWAFFLWFTRRLDNVLCYELWQGLTLSTDIDTGSILNIDLGASGIHGHLLGVRSCIKK